MPKKAEISSGVGSKVDPAQLDAAVDAYIELEEAGSVSKSEIGRRLGLERAPEWLDSPYFLRKLDVARFTHEVSRLKGVKESIGLLDRILDVVYVESMRRLQLDPASIPSSTLFGEALIKLVRLRQELVGSAGPRSANNIWINIQQEFKDVEDPVLRRKLANRLEDELRQALRMAGAVNEQTSDVVDVAAVELPLESAGNANPQLPAHTGTGDSRALFDDPAGPQS